MTQGHRFEPDDIRQFAAVGITERQLIRFIQLPNPPAAVGTKSRSLRSWIQQQPPKYTSRRRHEEPLPPQLKVKRPGLLGPSRGVRFDVFLCFWP